MVNFWGTVIKHRKCEAERGSGSIAALRPKKAVMQFDDGTADGEPHAHSVLLGSKKRFEDPVGFLQTGAAILYFHPDCA